MCKKTVLNNGIRVITEEVNYVNSVSIGLWINTGSINELTSMNGITHFIEHLLFKGTQKRSSIDIVKDIESVGGIINAFTSKEYTCIYAKVLDRYFPLAIETLSDILLNSRFDKEDIDKEREIVLQEIMLVEETPDDYVHDLFNYSLFYDHPLCYPVQGTTDSVKEIKREGEKRAEIEYRIAGEWFLFIRKSADIIDIWENDGGDWYLFPPKTLKKKE